MVKVANGDFEVKEREEEGRTNAGKGGIYERKE